MRHKLSGLFTLALALTFASPTALSACAQQQHQGHQPKSSNSHGHAAEAGERGDRAMGFSHEKTAHHFRLLRDGGAIEVGANDSGDAESRDKIRKHLARVAVMFAEGDFAKPEEVHAQVPPGVETMRRLKDEIKYEYAETEKGGRVRISTRNAEALDAVHSFLRFQIEDHATGDSTEVETRQPR